MHPWKGTVVVLLLMTGCSTLRQEQSSVPKLDPKEIALQDRVEMEDLLSAHETSSKDEVIPETTQEKTVLEDSYLDDVHVPKKSEALVKTSDTIPTDAHRPEVRKWIHYFTNQDRERFARFIERGARYKDLVSRILKVEGVPPEIFYLGVIESGYVTHAKSHASAVGIWQFIKGTGKRYGLRVNRQVDERRDPVRATRAAARYLRDLNERFQSWPLALAAYNSGEGRVASAIRRGRSQDYWRLSNLGYLPEETADYVPKFLAAVWIGQHPAQYGFDKEPNFAYPDLLGVEFPSHLTLSALAKKAKLAPAVLETVNPHVLTRSVPEIGHGKYVLWVPEEHAPVFRKISKFLEPLVAKVRRHPATAHRSWAHPKHAKRARTLLVASNKKRKHHK